jgi:hypothetical protein
MSGETKRNLVSVLRNALSNEPTSQLSTATVMIKGVQTKRPASRYFLIGMKDLRVRKISGTHNRHRTRQGPRKQSQYQKPQQVRQLQGCLCWARWPAQSLHLRHF